MFLSEWWTQRDRSKILSEYIIFTRRLNLTLTKNIVIVNKCAFSNEKGRLQLSPPGIEKCRHMRLLQLAVDLSFATTVMDIQAWKIAQLTIICSLYCLCEVIQTFQNCDL